MLNEFGTAIKEFQVLFKIEDILDIRPNLTPKGASVALEKIFDIIKEDFDKDKIADLIKKDQILREKFIKLWSCPNYVLGKTETYILEKILNE